MSFRTILLLLVSAALLFGFFTWASGHKESKKTGMIAFYNVENLFDTLDDPHKSDNDFLPTAASKWNTEKYNTKQKHLAQVIADLDEEGLVMLGLAEVENNTVLDALLHSNALADQDFDYLHEESKDPRGIDVALIYSAAFKPLFHKIIRPCEAQECLESRDILVVKGVLQKDTVWVYVNHWPSRRAGVEESADKRMLLSHVLKHAVDSVLHSSPSNKIIIMGDFNDTPQDRSIQSLTQSLQLLNPFAALKTTEVGSLKYKKDWYIYDQILLSSNWKSDKKNKALTYQTNTAAVFHPSYLHYKETLKNGPFRSYKGKTYYGGYSDHFPVYIQYSW